MTSSSSEHLVQRHYAQYIQKGGDGTNVLKERGHDLGYDSDFLKSCDLSKTNASSLFSASCGCGCPLRLLQQEDQEENHHRHLWSGRTVVDLGCGAGHDVIVASQLVGPQGNVMGVDFTKEMLQVAKRNAEQFGQHPNLLFVEASIEDTESVCGLVGSKVADIVISNGVVNLCKDKSAAFRTAFSVLKPGGKFLLSDLCVVEEENSKSPISYTLCDNDVWSN